MRAPISSRLRYASEAVRIGASGFVGWRVGTVSCVPLEFVSIDTYDRCHLVERETNIDHTRGTRQSVGEGGIATGADSRHVRRGRFSRRSRTIHGDARRSDPVQLACYRLAWAELNGLAPEEVDAVFYDLPTGTVVRPEVLPDRAGLEAISVSLNG